MVQQVVDEEEQEDSDEGDDLDMYEDTLARAAAMDSEDSVGFADANADNEDFGEEGSFVLSGTGSADPPLDKDDPAAGVGKVASADALV